MRQTRIPFRTRRRRTQRARTQPPRTGLTIIKMRRGSSKSIIAIADCISPLCIQKGYKKTLRIDMDYLCSKAFVECKKCTGKYDMSITADSTPKKVLGWYKDWYMRIYELKDLLKHDPFLGKAESKDSLNEDMSKE